jgi:hypothetical protein
LQIVIVDEIVVELAIQLCGFHVDVAVDRGLALADVGLARRSLDLLFL